MKNKTLIIAISCIDSRVSGYIMRTALEYAALNGNYDYLIVTPKNSDKPNHISVSMKLLSRPLQILDKLVDILKGNENVDGFSHEILTKKFLLLLKKHEQQYKNVIFHIHSFHDVPYSMPLIVKHIKINNYPCVYTIYDSWAYSGGCYNHEQFDCDGYISGCIDCKFGYNCSKQRLNYYSKRNISNKRYLQKINIQLPLAKTVFVPVSKYCENCIKSTPLNRYTMKVIKPETSIRVIDTNRDIKKELGIPDTNKVVVSACAFWCKLKGVDYLYEIADRLPKNYTLLVVGGDFDKRNYQNIVYIPFCDNISELPLYFQISDVFASVTQGDTFNVTIVEAQVCGVPIVGFGHGGTPETITTLSGIMVGIDNNIDKMVEQLIYVAEHKPFKKEEIINSGMRFASGAFKKEYLEIYETLGKI